jgi:putative PIN family toxin of toxin-antitoxin system
LIRAVVDTNILISGVIKPERATGEILRRLRDGEFALLYTEPLLVELAEVINRPRIRQKYSLGSEDIETVLALILLRGEPIDPTRRVEICRDPKDNMILEAAVAGQADMITSGDFDLLSLREFAGMPIISPAEFLQRLAKGPS